MIGADTPGEKGKPAERVGSEAAEALVNCLNSKCTVDHNLSDMLIPYMAAADGMSITATTDLSLHAKTNITITEQFLKTKFEVHKRNSLTTISCNGVGLRY